MSGVYTKNTPIFDCEEMVCHTCGNKISPGTARGIRIVCEPCWFSQHKPMCCEQCKWFSEINKPLWKCTNPISVLRDVPGNELPDPEKEWAVRCPDFERRKNV